MQKDIIPVNSGKTPYFLHGESAEDFFTKGEKGFNNLPKGTRDEHNDRILADGTVTDTDFYGESEESKLKFQNITSFYDPQVLTEFKENFKDLSANIDTGGAFDKRKLIATRNKSGIFDFGLASKGLLRQVEWFCGVLFTLIRDKDLPNPYATYGVEPGVVPSDFIETKYLNGVKYMAWIYKGREFSVQKRQAGVTKALNENGSLATTIAPGNIFTLVKPNKHLKFSSNYDKCYLQFTTSERNDKTVDLFVSVGGAWNLTQREFAYSVMPSLIVTEILQNAGIKVRINGTKAGLSISKDNYIGSTYVIKDYHEGFDWNKLMINAADIRTIRYNLFRSVSSNLLQTYPTQKNGQKWSDYDGLHNSYGVTNGTNNFREMTEKFKTYLLEEAKKGNNRVKTTDRNKMFFTATERLNPGEDEESLLQKATNEVNRLLTDIDMSYNTPSSVIRRTREKRKAAGETDYVIRKDLERVIEDMIKLPTKGEYAVSESDQKKALDNYKVAMQALNEQFK